MLHGGRAVDAITAQLLALTSWPPPPSPPPSQCSSQRRRSGGTSARLGAAARAVAAARAAATGGLPRLLCRGRARRAHPWPLQGRRPAATLCELLVQSLAIPLSCAVLCLTCRERRRSRSRSRERRRDDRHERRRSRSRGRGDGGRYDDRYARRRSRSRSRSRDRRDDRWAWAGGRARRLRNLPRKQLLGFFKAVRGWPCFGLALRARARAHTHTHRSSLPCRDRRYERSRSRDRRRHDDRRDRCATWQAVAPGYRPCQQASSTAGPPQAAGVEPGRIHWRSTVVMRRCLSHGSACRRRSARPTAGLPMQGRAARAWRAAPRSQPEPRGAATRRQAAAWRDGRGRRGGRGKCAACQAGAEAAQVAGRDRP